MIKYEKQYINRNFCKLETDRVRLPGNRLPNLYIPRTDTPLLFCTPILCSSINNEVENPNNADSPNPSSCKNVENIGKEQDQCCKTIPAIPPCPPQVKLNTPGICPTFCTGCKCMKIHANPPPTIQPIQIWGCTPHKFQ